MPKFTNVSGDDRALFLSTGAVLVLAGASVDLTDDQAEGIRNQDIWAEEKPKTATKEKPE